MATLLRPTDPPFWESNTSEPINDSFFQPTAHEALASTGDMPRDIHDRVMDIPFRFAMCRAHPVRKLIHQAE